MKKIMFAAMLLLTGMLYAEVTDVYKFKMSVYIPRIYDNMQSKGYRKFQLQKIEGYLRITYPETDDDYTMPRVELTDLTNKTHKFNGCYVTYETEVDEDKTCFVNYIGNNKTNVFKDPSICFSMMAEQVYAIGEADEDNSLVCTLSGRGTSKLLKSGARVIYSLKGSVAGALGCGCKEYGHTSPTRVAGACGPTDTVMDIAAIYGTWSAKYCCTTKNKCCVK